MLGFPLVCTVWSGREKGEVRRCPWFSETQDKWMMKPVVSLDCAICQDTYLVAIQGTTMKCRQKKKKSLLSSCQDCIPHPKTRKQRDRKTLGADPCSAHPWMRAQQTNCKNTHNANYRCLGILKGDGEVSQNRDTLGPKCHRNISSLG